MNTMDEELAQSYRATCAEHLAVMEQGLIALESGGAGVHGEIVDHLMQAARSVQAEAERCGLAKIAALAQRLGRVLAPMRYDRALPPSRERVTMLLRAIDALRAPLDDSGAGGEGDLSDIMSALTVPSAGAKALHGADWRLRALLVEDDFTSRLLLQSFLSRYGDCHVAVNGREAVEAFRKALEQGQRYDLICMDIMMPEMDGGEAVRQIRAMEEAAGVLSTDGARIFMTTAVNGLKDVSQSFYDLCDAYLVKPIDLAQLVRHMKVHSLVE